MSARRSRSWSPRRCIRRRTLPKRSRSASMRSPPRRTWRVRWRRTRRRSGRARPATSRSTGRTATRRRSMRRSPAPRMSSACGWSIPGLRRARWSRAPRIASFDASSQRYTLIAPTQGVAVVRKVLAEGVFKVPADRIRILTYDVGGGFGMKVQPYAEYAAMLCAARLARAAGQMVREPAGELSHRHPRPRRAARGRAGARRARQVPRPAGADLCRARRLYLDVRGDLRDREHEELPVERVCHSGDPYRREDGAHRCGAARPLSRRRAAGSDLSDRAPDRSGGARHEYRSRRAAPAQPDPRDRDALPDAERADLRQRRVCGRSWTGRWRWPTGTALRRAARRRERDGKLRGIGIGCFLEVAGGILDEAVDLRFEHDGKVALRTGAQAMGQGHLSTFVPLIAQAARRRPRRGAAGRRRQRRGAGGHAERRLALDHDGGQRHRARLRPGHREGPARHRAPVSRPTSATSSSPMARSGWSAPTAPSRSSIWRSACARPRCRRSSSGGLDNVAKFVSPQMSFPNGCHVCEVEIDPETGVVAVVAYTAVDDVGNVLHETIVAGQIHGGVAQGIGQVLGEQVIYGDDGQLLTASFMDYFMPRAGDVPPMSVAPPCGSVHDQPARRQGRRRVRRRRLAAVGGQRRARRLGAPRCLASRSADDAATGVVGAPAQPLRRPVGGRQKPVIRLTSHASGKQSWYDAASESCSQAQRGSDATEG